MPNKEDNDTSSNKLEEDQNIMDEVYLEEPEYRYDIAPSDGFQVGDDSYIVDPDAWFAGVGNFEDLIKIKR